MRHAVVLRRCQGHVVLSAVACWGAFFVVCWLRERVCVCHRSFWHACDKACM